MMDSQIFQLINERSDRQDRSLDEIKDLIRDHTKTDEAYWKRIDKQDIQLALLRKIILGMITSVVTVVSAIWAWMGR